MLQLLKISKGESNLLKSLEVQKSLGPSVMRWSCAAPPRADCLTFSAGYGMSSPPLCTESEADPAKMAPDTRRGRGGRSHSDSQSHNDRKRATDANKSADFNALFAGQIVPLAIRHDQFTPTPAGES